MVDLQSGQDIFPEGFNARSRVHEYGGGPAIVHGGVAYFTDARDLRVYKVEVNGSLPGIPVAVSAGKRGNNFRNQNADEISQEVRIIAMLTSGPTPPTRICLLALKKTIRSPCLQMS